MPGPSQYAPMVRSGEEATARLWNRHADSTNRVVSELDSLTRRPEPQQRPTSFFARLTGEPSTGNYHWRQVRRNTANNEWEDATGGLCSGEAVAASNMSSTGKTCVEAAGLSGLPFYVSSTNPGVVGIIRVAHDSTGDARYVFHLLHQKGGTKRDLSYPGEHRHDAGVPVPGENGPTGAPDFGWSIERLNNDRIFGRAGLKLTVITGVAYYHDIDQTLYCYARDLSFDAAGHLVLVGVERRVIADVTEECADQLTPDDAGQLGMIGI